MAYGIRNADAAASRTGAQSWAQGNYEISGISRWFSVDTAVDPPLPVFVPGLGEEGVARLNVKLADGGEGPPMSATTGQLVALVRAFGGDIKSIRPIEETTGFLLRVEKALQNSRNVLTAYVGSKGWIVSVSDTEPSAGTYTWKFTGYTSAEGVLTYTNIPAFKADVAWGHFTLVGDEFGEDSPYNGYVMSVPFVQAFTAPDYGEDGAVQPQFKTDANGRIPGNVAETMTFFDTFCPTQPDGADWDEYQWSAQEAANPLQVFFDAALEMGLRGVGEIVTSKRSGRRNLRLYTFRPESESVDMGESVLDVPVREEQQSTQPEGMYALVRQFEEMGRVIQPSVKGDFFVPTPPDSADISTTLTEEGRAWCRQNLVPIWDKLSLGEPRTIGRLNADQVTALLAELRKVDAAHAENNQKEAEMPF